MSVSVPLCTVTVVRRQEALQREREEQERKRKEEEKEAEEEMRDIPGMGGGGMPGGMPGNTAIGGPTCHH